VQLRGVFFEMSAQPIDLVEVRNQDQYIFLVIDARQVDANRPQAGGVQ